MNSTHKISLQHTAVVLLGLIIPLLPQLLANVNFGDWTNVVQALLTFIGVIYVTVDNKSQQATTLPTTDTK
jgi:formate-dependent nitrite reductase membrane component NrfD